MPKVFHEALVTLGLWDDFVKFNQEAQSYPDLVQRFEAFKVKAKDRYRELARENHPDHGGDGTMMQAINAAKDWLSKAQIAHRPPPPPMPVFHVRVVNCSMGTTTTSFTGTSSIFTGNF